MEVDVLNSETSPPKETVPRPDSAHTSSRREVVSAEALGCHDYAEGVVGSREGGAAAAEVNDTEFVLKFFRDELTISSGVEKQLVISDDVGVAGCSNKESSAADGTAVGRGATEAVKGSGLEKVAAAAGADAEQMCISSDVEAIVIGSDVEGITVSSDVETLSSDLEAVVLGSSEITVSSDEAAFVLSSDTEAADAAGSELRQESESYAGSSAASSGGESEDDDADTFACSGCCRRFASLVEKLAHERDQLATDMLMCETCDVVFYRRCARDLHVSIHGPGHKVHRCGACSRRFGAESAQAVCELSGDGGGDGGGRSFLMCAICMMRFREVDAAALQLHRSRHTNERFTACGRCTEVFSRRSQLRAHERAHLPVVEASRRWKPPEPIVI